MDAVDCRVLSINIIQWKLTRMNETSHEEYLGIGQVAETLGLFLYLINPAKSSFETIEECPDYVKQVLSSAMFYILFIISVCCRPSLL